jgi:small subunit ribosomal protein S6
VGSARATGRTIRKESILPFYENVFISRQDLAPQQAEALAQTFTDVVTGQGGKVTKNEYWGLRNLSFPIKKNRKGHYTLLNLDAPAAAIAELERQMRLHEDVLRYLTVKVEALEEGPSAMLQRREERAERERGERDRGGFRGGFRRDDRPGGPGGMGGPGGDVMGGER